MSHTVRERLHQAGSVRRLLAEHHEPNHASLPRQIAEIAYLWSVNRLGPLSYYRMGLFRTSIPWNEKKRFVSKKWYLDRIDRINPKQLRTAAWHKIVAGGVLRTYGIPSPRFYGFVSASNGQTADGHPLRDPDDLARLVRRNRLSRACFKPVGGWSGRGFITVSFHDAEVGLSVSIEPNGPPLPLTRFWSDYLDTELAGRDDRLLQYGYLCEAVIDQHPLVAAFHPESINTARVWMYQPEPGDWRMFGAVLRMGTGDARVDNGVACGIGAPIDLCSARLGRGVRRGRGAYRFQEFSVHPTTGEPIEGAFVPMWGEVRQLSSRTCAAFPFYKLMGLDVAFTPDGPIIVEVEADPHESHQAHMGRGIRTLIEGLIRAESMRLT